MRMDWDHDKLISSLYQTQYDKMYQVGYRITGSKELTQDLIQATFLLAILRQEKFSHHPNQEAWLMVTLKYLIQNEKRRLSCQNISLEGLFDVAAPTAPTSVEELLPSRLSKDDRDILIWRFEQGLDYRDIADLLGISQSGCRSRVSRAVKRCRELLREK